MTKLFVTALKEPWRRHECFVAEQPDERGPLCVLRKRRPFSGDVFFDPRLVSYCLDSILIP
jgi:hypothetical protein